MNVQRWRVDGDVIKRVEIVKETEKQIVILCGSLSVKYALTIRKANEFKHPTLFRDFVDAQRAATINCDRHIEELERRLLSCRQQKARIAAANECEVW